MPPAVHATPFLARLEQFISTPLRQFLVFFVAEFIAFFVIVANTRAYTQGNYLWTGITDLFFGFQSFALGKFTVDTPNARTWWAGLGETCGGTAGSLLAIWVTKHLYL
jgi:hypothetical protein